MSQSPPTPSRGSSAIARTSYEGGSRALGIPFADRLPFGGGQSLVSDDFEVAQQLLCHQLEERRVEPRGAAGRFDIRFNWQSMSQLKLFGAQWGVQGVRVRSTPLHSWHGILPLRGAMAQSGGRMLATSGELMLFSPGQEVDVVWHAGSRAVVFAVQEALVDEHLRRYHGTDTRQPQPQVHLIERSHPGLASLVNLMRLIDGESANGASVLLSASGQSHLQHLFCESLLELIPLPGVHDRVVLPGMLKRAVDFIHAHLKGRIDISDLVVASGASRRSLEQAFRHSLGTSPARYIMSRRLLAIREQLMQPGADEISLAELAFQWGFSQPSHFTTAYREAFGERPSDTLSRRVSLGTR